jgi:hypothetical protein
MADDNNIISPKSHPRERGSVDNGILGGIYGMAFIGGAIYYIQHATSFWVALLGIVKAILWPAVLMYKVLELLQM